MLSLGAQERGIDQAEVVTLQASGTPRESYLADLIVRQPGGLPDASSIPSTTSGKFVRLLVDGSIQFDRPTSDREISERNILANYAKVSPALAKVFELTVPPQAPVRTVFVPLA